MNIDEILGKIDELIDKSVSIPFISHKKFIDSRRIRELINYIRLNIPQELKEAKKIESDCQRILQEAKKNGEIIIRKAEEKVAKIISQEEVVLEARREAIDIIKTAQVSAENMQKNAVLLVIQILNDAENMNHKSILEIKRTKEKIQHTLENSQVFKKKNKNKD